MHTDRVEQAGLGAALVAATLLAYANALTAGFQFDDFHAIVDNPAVHSLQAWWQANHEARNFSKKQNQLQRE
mgnify:CR=1 FL=1